LWGNDILFAKQTLRIPNHCGITTSKERQYRSSIDSGTCTVEEIIERCDMELEPYSKRPKSLKMEPDVSKTRITIITPITEAGFECCIRKGLEFDYGMGKVEVPILLPSLKAKSKDCEHEWVQLQVLH
jgi:hypothetical protein